MSRKISQKCVKCVNNRVGESVFDIDRVDLRLDARLTTKEGTKKGTASAKLQ